MTVATIMTGRWQERSGPKGQVWNRAHFFLIGKFSSICGTQARVAFKVGLPTSDHPCLTCTRKLARMEKASTQPETVEATT